MSTTRISPAAASAAPVRIAANATVTKRLGHWTTDRRFEVRAHRGQAVLDLRSPQIPDGDIRIDVDLDHAVLKLLVADDATLDDWDLRRTGRGRVKDTQRPQAQAGRRIVIVGRMHSGEIRVQRGGFAVLTAMCSRAYLADVRRAHQEGGMPTVADPAGTH
ncbi:hypothetical protein ACFOSC_09240 [Streptantibioticus rubrisoli]|uniref:Uncharacterized protein n=1 Tax=Streptantibioticus rubrisoli TaxID=1387313 RepID=A0ABT1P685_9ACTN|nr:hypothetical protein [Streptantibioticus rubrisoli]MCQ4040894.1 hypothetical protein [Streptantibioticus rubrisoli]